MEQEEERMGEEKGREERRGEGTGTDSQTVRLLLDACRR